MNRHYDKTAQILRDIETAKNSKIMNDNPNQIECLSQKDRIKEYLMKGKHLTPLKALEFFQCFRLGARIYELKKDGLNIGSELVKDAKTGKHYSLYYLIN